MKKLHSNKILLSSLVIVLVIAFLFSSFSTLFSARAATVNELKSKLSQAQSEKAAAESKLNSIKSDKIDLEAEKKAIDLQLAELGTEIHTVNNQISEVQSEIDAKQSEIDIAQAELDEYTALYETRVRVMYECGNTSYLDVIFGSESFSDLLYRIDLVNQIVDYDQSIMDNMKASINVIKEAKAVIEARKEELEVSKSILDVKASQLESVQASKIELLSKLAADEATYKKILDDADAAEASLRAQIQSMTTSSSAATPAKNYSSEQFVWPTNTTYITSSYGTRFHPIQKRYKTHTGVDIGAGQGAPIYAAASGTVLSAGWNSGYGKYIVINHGGGVQTLYAHSSALYVQAGDTVTKGQTIAAVGSTGNSTGPHLHFEVLNYGQHTDPMAYFN